MKLLITIALLAAGITAQAQNYSKMSGHVRRIISTQSKARRANCSTGNNGRLLLFVKGEEAAVKDYCITHKGDIHIVNAPISELPALSEDPRIERLEVNFKEQRLLNDSAAAVTGVARARNDSSLPQAFDGTGVVVGSVDVTHDYSHPTFRSAKDGRMRIVRAWDMIDIPDHQRYNDKSNYPFGRLLTDTTDIIRKGHSADAHLDTHGTHTAGTAAGSGWGTPYAGMAPEADIYMATIPISTNWDLLPYNIQSAINNTLNALTFNNIFTYADSVGKPSVINFSIGEAQEITGEEVLQEEFMSRITGPGKIIVASAGNDGNRGHCYLPKARTQLTVGGRIATGYDFVTLSVKTRDKLTLRITNNTLPGTQVKSMEIPLDMKLTEDGLAAGSRLKPKEQNIIRDRNVLDDMEVMIYPDYVGFDNTYIGYDILLTAGGTPLSDGNYTLEITGEDSEAEAFMQYGELLPATGDAQSLAGGQYGYCICSPGSLPSVICVGATVWRNSFVNIDGKTMNYNLGKGGERADFSSVGPTMSGLTKPDVVAPGVLIASATNSHYTNMPDYLKELMTASTTFGGKEYYYNCDFGTSMATPVVTGAIALWLQADPTLTKERIMEVIAKTSTHPDPSLPYPNNQYGYGEINAYAGLLEVLNLSHVDGLTATPLRNATVRPTAGGSIRITFANATAAAMPCRIYSAAGSLLKSVTIPQQCTDYSIPADGLKGIIAVQVGGESTLIRL